MEDRARLVPDAAPVRHKAGQNAAPPVDPLRIAVVVHRLLGTGIALALPREFLVDPAAIEKFQEREIEDVGPHHWYRAVIAVVVPGAVRGQDQIAPARDAALALDRCVDRKSTRLNSSPGYISYAGFR